MSTAYFVQDGWKKAMEHSGDATLDRVGNEWASLSSSAPGETTKLMATAAKKCVKLGIHVGE